MALDSLVPFQGPKKSRFSGPTPSNAPRNDVAPLKIIMYRAIKTTGTLIVNTDCLYQHAMVRFRCVPHKEDIEEQPTSRNLSATATRVLQCTCPVAASRKDFSAFHTSPHLTPSPHT
jgi:hypothetical protein